MREKKKISAKEQGFYIYCCSSSWWNWKFDKIKNITETAQFFSRNAYCLVTNKRICRIEKVDWEMSGSQATDVWQY